MTLQRCTSLLLALPLLSAAAQGQAFNVDVGDNLILWPTPSNGYGAAAGQTGEWNAVATPYSETLANLAAVPTSVTLSSNVTSSYNHPFGTLGGDDDAFTSDVQAISFVGPAAVWTWDGLIDGEYTLYTYAWAPENNGMISEVTIVGDAASTQTVGGIWAGSPHVQGITYARHTFAVTGGSFSVEVKPQTSDDSGSVNGFQLVPGAPFSSEYCYGDGSASACPCGNFGSNGEGCANSGGGGATLAVLGTSSVLNDDLRLRLDGAQGPVPGLLFSGEQQVNGGQGVIFGDGLRCAGGPVKRLGVMIADGSGSATWGPGLAPQGGWSGGDTRYFQVWYRDTNGSPCGGGFNLTHGVAVDFTN